MFVLGKKLEGGGEDSLTRVDVKTGDEWGIYGNSFPSIDAMERNLGEMFQRSPDMIRLLTAEYTHVVMLEGDGEFSQIVGVYAFESFPAIANIFDLSQRVSEQVARRMKAVGGKRASKLEKLEARNRRLNGKVAALRDQAAEFRRLTSRLEAEKLQALAEARALRSMIRGLQDEIDLLKREKRG